MQIVDETDEDGGNLALKRPSFFQSMSLTVKTKKLSNKIKSPTSSPTKEKRAPNIKLASKT